MAHRWATLYFNEKVCRKSLSFAFFLKPEVKHKEVTVMPLVLYLSPLLHSIMLIIEILNTKNLSQSEQKVFTFFAAAWLASLDHCALPLA